MKVENSSDRERRCATCKHWHRQQLDHEWVKQFGPDPFGACTGRVTGDPMHDLTRSRSHQDHVCNKWDER